MVRGTFFEGKCTTIFRPSGRHILRITFRSVEACINYVNIGAFIKALSLNIMSSFGASLGPQTVVSFEESAGLRILINWSFLG